MLKSRWVVPERLTAEGYWFEQPEPEPAIARILSLAKSPRTR